MSYVKAEKVLPEELVTMIQEYIDGQNLYIPKKNNTKKQWGECTHAKQIIFDRDEEIYKKYLLGSSSKELATEYFLSIKSIQRIVLQGKRRTV